MQLSELKAYAEKLSNAFPQMDEQIRDLYFLAVDEVERWRIRGKRMRISVFRYE
jgi:hypothetical protein